MVIDSSALIALLFREPEAETFTTAIATASTRLVGTPSVLETTMVAVGRLGPIGRSLVERMISDIAARVASFTPEQANRAIDAFLRYGKGRHPAGLNFGDCCSYALAADAGLPLLFKGTDFGRTDIRPALPP
jgi:ribonuclease VapC